MAGRAGFNLPVHVLDGLFKIFRVISVLITVLVKIGQFFTGLPMGTPMLQSLLITFYSQSFHPQGFLAQAAVIMEDRGVGILFFGSVILCQSFFIFFVVQVNMAADHTVLHALRVFFYGGLHML